MLLYALYFNGEIKYIGQIYRLDIEEDNKLDLSLDLTECSLFPAC